MTSDYLEDLRLAHTLADNADSISMARFRALDLRVDTKPDLTPVSDADLAVETALRNVLSRSRPRDAVHSEEGDDTGWGPRRWVIDPIDGTANYIRGVPIWATLIALMDGDEVVLGVVSAPALGRRWWAHTGGGAFAGKSLVNGTRIHTSGVTRLTDASISYSSLSSWMSTDRSRGFVRLLRKCWRTRAYGDFWSYMLLAEGAIDIATEPELELHDMAALVPIVTEAGGIFTSLTGDPGPGGPGAIATNGLLHDVVAKRLAPSPDGDPQSLG